MSRFIKIDDAVNDERMAYFNNLLPEDLEINDSCHLIGAVDDAGCPEGAVVFTFSGQVTTILYIEVYPELRRQGIGTALIFTLLEYLVPVEYPILIEAYYILGDEDGVGEEVDAFFKSLPDFEVVSGGKFCTVTSHTVWNSKRLKLLENFSCSVKPVTTLNKMERGELNRYLSEKNLLLFLEGDDEKIIPTLSLCHVEEGKCSTLVVFRDSEIKRSLEISFLMSRAGEADNLSGVLNEVIRRLKALYPHHNLLFSLVNRDSEQVVKRFFTKDLQVKEIYNAISFGRI